MSPTCRRHVANIAKCCQILADIACRCDTEEAPTYPIYINYYRQVQISPNIRVPSIIEFLCLSSNNNHDIWRHVGNPPTCRQMSCRFGHPADTTFLVSATWPATCPDMSLTQHRMSPFGQQNRHADIRHVELSQGWYWVLLFVHLQHFESGGHIGYDVWYYQSAGLLGAGIIKPKASLLRSLKSEIRLGSLRGKECV